jgi:hypothetical protein
MLLNSPREHTHWQVQHETNDETPFSSPDESVGSPAPKSAGVKLGMYQHQAYLLIASETVKRNSPQDRMHDGQSQKNSYKC